MRAHQDPAPSGPRPAVPRAPVLPSLRGWVLFTLACFTLSGLALGLHWVGAVQPEPASLRAQFVLVYNDLQYLHAKAQQVCSARAAGDAGSARVHEIEYDHLAAAYDSAYERAVNAAGKAPDDLPGTAPTLERELLGLGCR